MNIADFNEQLKNAATFDDLENLGLGNVVMDISHRDGYLGFYGRNISMKLGIPIELLPQKIGVYCNYLGGGVRGKIQFSTFSDKISQEDAEVLYLLCEACKRVYQNIEDELGLNDDVDDYGEVNWDAVATNAARRN